MRTWTESEERQLAGLLSKGASCDEIAPLMGKTIDAVRNKAKRLAPRPVADIPGASELKAAGQKAEVDRLRAEIEDLKRPKMRLAVECDAPPPIPMSKRWELAEEDNARRIDHSHKRSRFRVDLGDKPIGLCFVSDQHISISNTVDLKRMREDAELIARTDGLYAVLGGDGVDNHLRIPAAILAARSQPDEQWELYEWYLSIFADKIVCMISGNHDHYSDQVAGVDMASRLAKSQRICYAPAEARIEVTVGEQVYRAAVRHQFRMNSGLNQTHAPKMWLRMGEEDFDIGCIGHHHEAASEHFIHQGKTRWVCRPGAYQISSSFTKQYGWNEALPAAPTVLLFGKERLMIGFNDVRHAVKTLAAERA